MMTRRAAPAKGPRFGIAFTAAPPEHRWTRDLVSLWTHLNAQARPTWGDNWVALPSGAVVSLRRREDDGRREVLLYRKEPFRTEQGPSLWAKEVETFAQKFGVQAWDRIDETNAYGIPKTRLVEAGELGL